MFVSISISFAVEDSLFLYMSFDTIDGDEVIDHSIYGNHGQIMGDTKHVTGRFDKALEFDGDMDFVEIAHHESLTVDEALTAMAWIKPERHSGPGNAQWQGIFAKGSNPRSYSLWTHRDSKCLHLSIGPSSTGGSNCNTELKLNVWQHVAVHFVDGTHRYWINGEKIGEFSDKPNPPGLEDTNPVVIGTAGGNNIRWFLGMIDEVRIWNRALSENEIKDQMNKGHFDIFPVDPRQKLTTTWGYLKEE